MFSKLITLMELHFQKKAVEQKQVLIIYHKVNMIFILVIVTLIHQNLEDNLKLQELNSLINIFHQKNQNYINITEFKNVKMLVIELLKVYVLLYMKKMIQMQVQIHMVSIIILHSFIVSQHFILLKNIILSIIIQLHLLLI